MCPQTFISTGLAILYCGAKPVFCDIQVEVLEIFVQSQLAKSFQIELCFYFCFNKSGYPCDMDKFNVLLKKINFKFIIEDSLLICLINKYKNKKIGQISDFTCSIISVNINILLAVLRLFRKNILKL